MGQQDRQGLISGHFRYGPPPPPSDHVSVLSRSLGGVPYGGDRSLFLFFKERRAISEEVCSPLTYGRHVFSLASAEE